MRISGITLQSSILKYLENLDEKCRAYFKTVYWQVTYVVQGLGIAASGTVGKNLSYKFEKD